MPLTMDMTTMRVVVEITTPSKVRKERSLWERSASTAIQKASRAVTQRLVCSRRTRCGFGRGVGVWLMDVLSCQFSVISKNKEPGRLDDGQLTTDNRQHSPS